MIPLVEILRMAASIVSAIYRLPDESNAMPLGPERVALAAGPPSPDKPLVLLPAMVEMIPVPAPPFGYDC